MLESTDNRLDLFDRAAIAIGACTLGAAAYVARYGPAGPLPMHFRIDGEVDRWGSRFQMVGVLVFLSLTIVGLQAIMTVVRRRRVFDDATRRAFTVGRVFALVIPAALIPLCIRLGLGLVPPGQDQSHTVHLIGVGLAGIFAIGGAVVGKVSPNLSVGVRTYWTFHSRLAWDKANRLLGRIFFLGGLACLLASPFLPALLLIAMVLVVCFGGAIAATFESWRVWRTDPERTA